MIYLDNAATTSPKPDAVIREVNKALRMYSANPGRGGHTPSVNASRAVYDARTRIKEFFHAPSEESVVFTSGCTQSLNTVIKGVLKPGDHVVISSLEHNAVLRPLHRMKQKGIIDFSVARAVPGDDEATIRAFRNAINQRTRMMICTHASNVFGFRMPVERLCALAHSYGVLFCLDAAQSAGILDIDILQDGYDYVCCPGHKGLYGPTGIGILLMNRDELLDPLIEGGTGSGSDDPNMPEFYPDRLECGTLNIPGICGMSGGIRFVNSKGRDRLSAHEMRLMKKLYHRLSGMRHVILYADKPDISRSVPVLSFNIKDADCERVSEYLDKRYRIAVRAGLHCAPLAHKMMGTLDTGAVRISPSAFTTEKDIDILASAIEKFNYFS